MRSWFYLFGNYALLALWFSRNLQSLSDLPSHHAPNLFRWHQQQHPLGPTAPGTDFKDKLPCASLPVSPSRLRVPRGRSWMWFSLDPELGRGCWMSLWIYLVWATPLLMREPGILQARRAIYALSQTLLSLSFHISAMRTKFTVCWKYRWEGSLK